MIDAMHCRADELGVTPRSHSQRKPRVHYKHTYKAEMGETAAVGWSRQEDGKLIVTAFPSPLTACDSVRQEMSAVNVIACVRAAAMEGL